LTVLQVIEHYFDFLQFYVVPTMDFIEQPPSVSLRRRIFPLPVGVDDLLLSVEVIKSPHDHLATLHEPVATKSPPSVSVKAHATPPGNRVSNMIMAQEFWLVNVSESNRDASNKNAGFSREQSASIVTFKK
jgi:hypothetical protein